MFFYKSQNLYIVGVGDMRQQTSQPSPCPVCIVPTFTGHANPPVSASFQSQMPHISDDDSSKVHRAITLKLAVTEAPLAALNDGKCIGEGLSLREYQLRILLHKFVRAQTLLCLTPKTPTRTGDKACDIKHNKKIILENFIFTGSTIKHSKVCFAESGFSNALLPMREVCLTALRY